MRLKKSVDINELEKYGFKIAKSGNVLAYLPNIKDKYIVDINIGLNREIEIDTFEGLLYHTEDIVRSIETLNNIKEFIESELGK